MQRRAVGLHLGESRAHVARPRNGRRRVTQLEKPRDSRAGDQGGTRRTVVEEIQGPQTLGVQEVDGGEVEDQSVARVSKVADQGRQGVGVRRVDLTASDDDDDRRRRPIVVQSERPPRETPT